MMSLRLYLLLELQPMNARQPTPQIKDAIARLVLLIAQQDPPDCNQDSLIQKQILGRIVPLIGPEESVLNIVKELLTDPAIDSPRKYVVLMYLSLVEITPERVSDLFKFYYELTTLALKELKERDGKETTHFWEVLFEKIYQYGMLLLIGSKSVLLSVQSLGLRVNTLMLADKAKEMRLSRLVKIYNTMLCIPERYLTLKQTLYFTLLFTRWELNQSDTLAPSFFALFMVKTQKKLIRKLRSYPSEVFNQEHILNLVKIILGGNELIFSFFLQIKYSYEAVKMNSHSSFRTERAVFEAIRKCPVEREGRHLFNFIIELLLNFREQQPLTSLQRQSIIYVCLKFLSGKYDNNEGLFIILVRGLLQQRNEQISQISFRFIREQVLQYLTVHKVKLLLNLFNNQNWQRLLKDSDLNESIILGRLERVIALLVGMARRYSDNSLAVQCQSGEYGVEIRNVRNVKSIVLVVSFDGVGLLSESDGSEMQIIRINLGKDLFYQVTISFAEVVESLISEGSQPKERTAVLTIATNTKQLVSERKQYLRYGQGCFESLFTFTFVGRDMKKIAFCVDGAFYQFQHQKKAQIVGIELGDMKGSIRSFYGLKTEIDLIVFHKIWCEWDRKAKFVVESLGTQHIAYSLNSRQQPIIVDANSNTGLAFFQNKTEFKFNGIAVKNVTFMDVLMQLGGLQTIFFIMQRFSQSLLHFRESGQKINMVLSGFFNFLRVSAVIDETMYFLDDILHCFQYLNQFLFLLVKRNKMVRDSQNSSLLLSIFELLIYFRKERLKNRTVSNGFKQKMARIEVLLVLKTLTNFQVWSNCSISLQLFVLSQIKLFLRAQVHISTFIIKDLHKQLLSNMILFSTSDGALSGHSPIHHKLIELCTLLYEKSKAYVAYPETLKEIAESSNLSYQPFVQRDVATCLSLIQALLKNKEDRSFSDSQKSAFETLIKYFIANFVVNQKVFSVVGKVWGSVAFTFCSFVKQMRPWDTNVAWHCLMVITQLTAIEETLDIWIMLCFQNVIGHETSSFVDCFRILGLLVDQYPESSKKQVIFNKVLNLLYGKLQLTDSLDGAIAFRQIMSAMSVRNLYYLSTFAQFQQLLALVKACLFQQICNVDKLGSAVTNKSQSNELNSGQGQKQIGESQVSATDKVRTKLKLWIEVNEEIIVTLYRQAKINNLNSNLVKRVIMNLYEAQPEHKLAVCQSQQLLLQLSQVRQLAKQSFSEEQNKYSKYGLVGALALIEHCRCWAVLYFLIRNQLLTTDFDLTIPSDYKPTDCTGLIGGTLAYYLSSPSSPIELYAIFITILYKQLSNNISLLITQASIVIFQYCVEYLFANVKEKTKGSEKLSNGKEAAANVEISIVLLKQLVKSLNLRFVNRVSAISKSLQKLLGKVSKKMQGGFKSIKNEQIVQNLNRATASMQMALQEDRVDRDITLFIQNILDRLTGIEYEQSVQLMEQVGTMVEQLAVKQLSHSQLQLRKLGMVGLRFFQIARDFCLSKQYQVIFVTRKGHKGEQKMPEVSAKQLQSLGDYRSLLTEKFDAILLSLSERGIESQQKWEDLMITNQHWFDLQQDVDDVTTKFYELDDKEIGPYGFYHLNIRPVRTDHEKLPYPRRQEYLEMMTKKKEEKYEPPLFGSRLTIEDFGSNLFSMLSESSIIRQRTTRSRDTTLEVEFKSKSYENKLYCELVTKRGTYAGTLTRRKGIMQFAFMGHLGLPQERVYQMSTKCHRIESLLQWEEKEFRRLKIPLKGSRIFTRRYIMRHTAFEITNLSKHRTYFFNMFERHLLVNFLNDLRNSEVEIIDDRADAFEKGQFTEKWRRGELSNFQYLSLVNQYSGRSFNDLAQYPVMPWVIRNFQANSGYKQIKGEFYKTTSNLRDLSQPIGKLDSSKFDKLKSRLQEVDPRDREIRFLFGSMYSNPTVLYNFFIRLQPFTSLHWQHQGRRIDHADRLFSGIAEQFATVLTSSSDNKQLAPQFYYWTEFLKNRNRIELGRKQRGDDVDAVVLPPWSRSPQQFIFKMREALESKYASEKLHLWIDLIFGVKSPYEAAEKHDNLYHYQCYEHDLFTEYQTENEMKIAQITISEFGQIPQQLFKKEHPQRNTRNEIDIDTGIVIHKGSKIRGFQHNEVGILLWSDEQVFIKKVAVAGLFHSFEETKQFACRAKTYFLESISYARWITLNAGLLHLVERGKTKMQKCVQVKCIDMIGVYTFYGCGSKIIILRLGAERFEDCSILYGHRDEIILIKTDHLLDVIVSVDRSGYVLVHELTELRFLRAFQLGTDFEGEQSQQLRLCVHQMGYFIFLDHEQTIWIFNFMGELILEQDFEVKAGNSKGEEERITDIQLLSQESSLLLMASSRGNVYQINFLQVIRFRDVYPYKTYSRLQINLLARVRAADGFGAIRQLSVAKCSAEKNVIYQLLVLYESGELVCYTEEKELGKQLRGNERLNSMGFF